MTRAEKVTFSITGMDCVGCVSAIENAVMPMKGVEYVGVCYSSMTMTVRPGPGVDVAAIASRVRLLGYGVDEEVRLGTAPKGDCPCRVNSRRPVDNSS